jgi:dsRNA-specific ribonuclease
MDKDVSVSGNDMSWMKGEKISPVDIFYNDFTDKKWVKQFYDYTRLVVSKLIDNMSSKKYDAEHKKRILDLIVNPKTIKYFVYGVTHKSVQVDDEKNYEAFETVGDKYMASTFVQYLKKRFVNISADGLTNFLHKIVSKDYQPEAADGMGLSNWAIIFQPDKKGKSKLYPGRKVKEDMLESFFGVIAYVLDLEDSNGYLIDILMSFNHLCFDDRTFNFDTYKSKDSPSVIGQFFQQTVGNLKEGGFKMKEEIMNDGTPKKYYNIYLYIEENKNIELKEKFGVYFKNRTFGEGSARNKSEAEKNAFEDARKNMYKIFGEDIFSLPKNKKQGKIENKDSVIRKANKDMKRSDIVDVIIEIIAYKGEITTIFQLQGILKNEKKIILYTKIFENNNSLTADQKREKVINEYLET